RLPGVAGKKILVVDDKGANVTLLKAVLESVGTVDAAADGSEALSLVRKGYYSAIVTDVDMPRINGIEFYRMAVEHLPDLRDRFIFFTASADEDKITFFRKNNVRYLRKPSPISDIRKTVREIALRHGKTA
ncbi:MAG: response regulator, partial [Deltaproteobacteria bacterium]|nr:response regulator [Deltaproteobacteria bacterium]